MAGRDSFTFLHLTDVHSAFDNLEKIKQLMKCSPRNGDLTNMKPEDNADSQLVQENEEEVVKVIEAMQDIHPLVYFIPGNHDACSYFNGKGKTVSGAINLHKKHLRLTDDLVLTSFGGSVPAFQGGKQRWIGYPFEKAEDVEKELREFLGAELAADNSGEAPTDGDSVLLMTHCGPGSSQTTIQQIDLDQEVIYAGCYVLDKILREDAQQQRVFLNIHGHTHFAEGISKLGNTFIFNPGSVRFGSYGIITICKKENKWTYKSMEMLTI